MSIINFSHLDILDLIAASCGVASCVYAMKNDIKTYPTGLVGVLIYFYLLYQQGIYGDIVINVYYAIMIVYGWFLWSKKNQRKEEILKVTFLHKKEWWLSSAFIIKLWLLFWLFLYYLTDSNITYIDALTSALAVAGMYWMTQRKVEYWLFFIVMDIICIFVYINKNLYFSAAHFLILTIIASLGYRKWKKIALRV